MKEALIEFGRFLEQEALSFEATIIGGAALLVMGVIDRATQNVDCLDPDIPDAIREAASRSAKVHVLGRPDMLKTKLFAFCDRGQDESDCVALAPSAEELRECLPWVAERDAHPQWPEHVKRSFAALAEDLGYELEA